MTPADIPYPLPPAILRAAARHLNAGVDHGALANLARVTGTAYRTLQGYASGAHPVPRPLAVSIRNLVALRAITTN